MIDTPGLLKHYRMDTAALADYTGEGPLNKDSFPVLEFECPKGLYGHSFTAYRELAQAGASPPDSSWIKGMAPEKLAAAGVRQEAFRQLEMAESLLRSLEEKSLARAENTKNLIGHLEKIQESFALSHDGWLDQHATAIGFRATRTAGKNLQEYLLFYRMAIAQALQKQGNPLDAASQVEKALRFTGDNPEVLRNFATRIANACLQEKNPAGGIAIMAPLFSRFPDNAGISEFYGILHGAAGQDVEAESLLKRALELSPGDDVMSASIHHNLGYLYQQRGNLAAARESYEKALQINPDHPGTRQRLEGLQTPDGN